MAISTVQIEIKGLSALLMHRFPLEPIKAIEKKTPEEQAELAAYRTDGGELFVPGLCLQRALISGAAYSKGKGRATLQKPAAACFQISPEYLFLGTKKYAIDSRPVVVPATKGRVIRHRPRIDEWKVSFLLEYDDTLLKATEVRQIVDDTGLRVGLLDFRPERKGPFGRFNVTQWDDS